MAESACKEEDRNLIREQLAAAVRSIQWSYAIFWCRPSSSTEQGVLHWGEGYYNGDIKTRKTVQNMDFKADQIGSQRSDQLRELYDSLVSVKGDNQARRPLASLSPEDLTNLEWYYLVCMSFVFNVGEGLPGTSLANDQPIWLCNVHCADQYEVFYRYLLAKSAGIKTVVCFPFQSGVIELGATNSVQEDLDLIQHVQTILLENSSQSVLWKANSMTQFSNDELQVNLPPSRSGSSNGVGPMQPPSDVFLLDLEGLSGEVSPAHLLEDDLSNRLPTSLASSECISQTIENLANVPSSPRTEDENIQEKYLQDCEQGKRSSLYSSSKDFHYQNLVSSLNHKSGQPVLRLSSFPTLDKKSSFISWTKGEINVEFRGRTTQSLLKKVLFEVPRMHSAHLVEPKKDGVRKDGTCKQVGDVPNTNHVLAERKRREKVNERFAALRSLIPSISKVDKISILDDTIRYLKELERRVEELESRQEVGGYEIKKKRRTFDVEERTSDNYGHDITADVKKKARPMDEVQECGQQSTRDNLIDKTITVCMAKKEITINVRCPWRESLLLEIIDTISSLDLESQSVQSSTVDGVLSLSMKSTLEGSSNVSIGRITQVLQRVINSARG